MPQWIKPTIASEGPLGESLQRSPAVAGRGRPPGSQVIVRGGEGSESFSEEKKKFHHPIYLEKERERKKDMRQNSILLLSLALLTNIGTTSGGFFFSFLFYRGVDGKSGKYESRKGKEEKERWERIEDGDEKGKRCKGEWKVGKVRREESKRQTTCI